jgi:5-methylcytosine-specific restriction endonuclease McrA
VSSAAPHPCPRCRRPIVGRCQTCRAANARERDKARPSARARGYGEDWSRYSRTWLMQHRWCGERADGTLSPDDSRCVQAGLRRRAAVTDHIVPLRDGGARLDPGNHQSLCISCNRLKA